jgi:hypothetical protein
MKKLLKIICMFWLSIKLLSKTFLILKRIEYDTIITVAHPASCTIGTGSFPGVKQLGHGADHPLPSSAEVENG